LQAGVPTKLIGASCGLCAFAIAVICGLAVDNPGETILGRAIVAMLGAQVVGFIVGSVCERTVGEAVEAYRAARPIPQVKGSSNSGTPAQGAGAIGAGVPASGAPGAPASAGVGVTASGG
jgi:hypothetical protein